MRERGSTSVVVLAVLLFISALFLAAGALLELTLRQLRGTEERRREDQVLRAEAQRFVGLLLDDPTPFADSAQDPVWAQAGFQGSTGVTVRLADLSGRLGLNWVRKEVLEDMQVLKPGKTPAELQQFREDSGIHLNLEPDFLDFFSERDLEGLFTAYGYFNINVADEFVLRKVCLERGGDPALAERVHGLVQEARVEKKQIEPAELEDFLGADAYELLFPVVNAEAPMNVHFTPERVLRALFRHYEVPVDRVEHILAVRGSGELTPPDLEQLIGPEEYKKTPLRHYLGLNTWFWEIRVADGERELTWVLARVPHPEGQPELRLIEERESP